MPRIFIVAIFVILITGVVAGGGFLLWQQFGSQKATSGSPGSLFGALPSTEKSNVTPPPASANTNDNDNDGLSNNDELTWKTDPNNPDTDGDGYLDGEEVKANHDPIIPAPNDKLPTEPTTVASQNLTAEKVESFFADDLNLTGSTQNLTDEYKKQEVNNSPTAMNKFADSQPINTRLPRPNENSIPIGEDNNTALIQQYLSIADNPNVLANSSLYKQAQYDLQVSGNPGTMQGYASLIRTYRQELEQTTVPVAALSLHKLLLGYTELLAATLDQIALWNDDPVKSLTATRQLEAIDRQYYPIIYQELQRLQALQ